MISYLSRKLRDPNDLKNFLDSLYTSAAQYDAPPSYPVSIMCGGIDRAPNGTDILGRIAAGVAAFRPNMTCNIIEDYVDETSEGWGWQVSISIVHF